MHKKAILLFLLFATICVGALTYVNNVFLPVKLKEMIIQETSKKLNRSVSIEDLYYVPLKGLVLKNVIIQDRAPKVEKIFSAQEISISIFYIPLIFQKKIIIPSLVVDDPVLLISRERTGSWNFQDLLTPERKQDDSSSFSAYIAGLTINNGTLLLFDKNVTREAIERIDHIHIRASLSLPQNMKATVKVFPRGQKSLKIFADLNYDFISQDFLCQLRAENIFLENFSEYINRPGLNLKKAKISLVALDLSQRAGKITGRGECVFDAVQMDLQEKNTVTFSPTLATLCRRWPMA
ncbi:MAG TPA: AsmA family protein, partial [Candidatus Omnitrophota bacterium]|nr:AsmA family protein [Candidatus Omnitrophota bacterium]